jgi:hypothetical protein
MNHHCGHVNHRSLLRTIKFHREAPQHVAGSVQHYERLFPAIGNRQYDHRGTWSKVTARYRMCRNVIVTFGSGYAILSDHNLTAHVIDQLDVEPSLVGSRASAEISGQYQSKQPTTDHIHTTTATPNRLRDEVRGSDSEVE